MLARTRSLLESLQIKLAKNKRLRIDRLILKLRGKKSNFLSRPSMANYTDEELWEIFADLQSIVSQLEQLEKDAMWE